MINLPLNYRYNVEKGTLYKGEKEIMLGNNEKKLLFLLVKNRGNFIAIDTILDYVWEGKEVGEADMRMLIKKIRDKTDKTFIITAKGIGYKIEK